MVSELPPRKTMPEVANQVARSDSLEEAFKRNPHKWWRNWSLWRRWRRAQVLFQDFARMRVGLDDWECETLVPNLRGGIDRMETLLNEIKRTCNDPGIRAGIGPAIRAITFVAPGRDPVAEYLDATTKQIDDEFLARIASAKDEGKQVTNLRTLARFANSVRFIASMITSTQKTLFSFGTKVHLQVTNHKTGEVTHSGEPEELAIILLPFKNVLENLVGMATATVWVIDQWQKQLAERKNPFLEYLTANAMDSANRRTVHIQILTIIIAAVLSSFFLTAADPLSLYRKNAELTDHVRQLEQASTVSEANQRRLTKELETVRSNLVAAQREATATSAEITRLREENADLRRRVKR